MLLSRAVSKIRKVLQKKVEVNMYIWHVQYVMERMLDIRNVVISSSDSCFFVVFCCVYVYVCVCVA